MVKYFHDIWLGIITVLKSMAVACRHFFTRSVTLQYPTERWTMPERSRARLLNNIEDCIGCQQCLRVCPTHCIAIKTEKRGKEEPEVFASNGMPIKLRALVFDIDMTICCYCGLCTFTCPTHCLVMTPAYEYSVYDKKEHIYHFAQAGALPGKPPGAPPPASI
jgi:formate hydrogenlyase subunit 6/NADH:ubiquinone oxidoreductase subunit I